MNGNIMGFMASMLSSLSNGGYGTWEDFIYCANETVYKLKNSLMIEVIELYEDKGYSYEDIEYLIDMIEFDSKDNLTKEEEAYLKNSAKEVLNIRKSLREKIKLK